MKKEIFVKKLLVWYQLNKRPLPWRETIAPYRIWLSEIILQQTRVAQGLPYYEKFIHKYPTINDLASASETQVLSDWQGLGYYSRAKNLHTCAKEITHNYNGKFPQTYEELLRLKGIGKYTAAAIASFAFKQKVPVVDGNVFRVICRLCGIKEPVNSPLGEKKVRTKAEELICDKNPDTFNQAIMEFGALQCVPANPDCSVCPFHDHCIARKENLQALLPVKTKKVKSRKRYLNYLVVTDNEYFLFNERTGKDIWSGLFDFPLIESDRLLCLEELFDDEKHSMDNNQSVSESVVKNLLPYMNKMKVSISKDYKHVLTHQQLHARFFLFQPVNGTHFDLNLSLHSEQNSLKKVLMNKIDELPKPVLISNYLKEYCF